MTQDTASPRHAPLSPELERLAQKRVSAQLGWFSHAAVYVVVVSGLALAGWWQGRLWPAAPLWAGVWVWPSMPPASFSSMQAPRCATTCFSTNANG